MPGTIQILPSTNLFTLTSDAIGHGCNTKGFMGSGIAKEFRSRWPSMYEDYKVHCIETKFNWTGCYPYELLLADGGKRYVYNLATQEQPGPHATLERCDIAFTAMLEHAVSHNVETISMPYMVGCGIGSLEADDVLHVLSIVNNESSFSGKIILAQL